MKRLLIFLLVGLLTACQLVPNTQIGSVKTGLLAVRIQTAYQTQALDALIAHITFTLTGDNLPAPATINLTRSQFQENRATVKWEKLLPGPVHLAATVYDSQERVLATAEGNATVVADQTSDMTLTVTPVTGSVNLALSLGSLGDPIPSVSLSLASVPPHSWQSGPSLSIARANATAVVLNGTAYVLGGDYNTEIESYDAARGRWVPRLLPLKSDMLHLMGQAGVLRNRILLVGRDVEYSDVPEISYPVLFDPLTMTSQVMTLPLSLTDYYYFSRYVSGNTYLNLMAARTGTGVASDGEHLYMVGGTSKRHNYDVYAYVTYPLVERLNAANELWDLCAPMPTKRASLGTAMLNGKLYAAGGFVWEGTPMQAPHHNEDGVDANGATMKALTALEVYDPALDTWATCSAMPTARYALSLVPANGRLYAIGGINASGCVVNTVESYDPVTKAWRSEPAMPTARALHGAVCLDGLIYAIGGVGSDNGRPLRAVDVFNPEEIQ